MKLEELIGAQVAIPSTSGDVQTYGVIIGVGYAGYLRVVPPLDQDYTLSEIPTPNDNEIGIATLRLAGFPAVDMIIFYPEANSFLSLGNSSLEAGGEARIWIHGSIKPRVRLIAYSTPTPDYYLEIRLWKLIIKRVNGESGVSKNEVIHVVPYPNPDVASIAVSKLLDAGFKQVRLLEWRGE